MPGLLSILSQLQLEAAAARWEIVKKYFQFFPSCSSVHGDAGRRAAHLTFQFFPSCSAAAARLEVVRKYVLSILSQLQHWAGVGGRPAARGRHFQFFPSCSRSKGREPRPATGRRSLSILSQLQRHEGHQHRRAVRQLRLLQLFQFFPSCSEDEEVALEDEETIPAFNSFPVAA